MAGLRHVERRARDMARISNQGESWHSPATTCPAAPARCTSRSDQGGRIHGYDSGTAGRNARPQGMSLTVDTLPQIRQAGNDENRPQCRRKSSLNLQHPLSSPLRKRPWGRYLPGVPLPERKIWFPQYDLISPEAMAGCLASCEITQRLALPDITYVIYVMSSFSR